MSCVVHRGGLGHSNLLSARLQQRLPTRKIKVNRRLPRKQLERGFLNRPNMMAECCCSTSASLSSSTSSSGDRKRAKQSMLYQEIRKMLRMIPGIKLVLQRAGWGVVGFTVASILVSLAADGCPTVNTTLVCFQHPSSRKFLFFWLPR